MPLDATPVEETNLPRHLIFRGRKVRVIGYVPKNDFVPEARFQIIDTDDSERLVRRSQVERFVK